MSFRNDGLNLYSLIGKVRTGLFCIPERICKKPECTGGEKVGHCFHSACIGEPRSVPWVHQLLRLDYQQGKERRKMTVLAVITGALSLYLLDALLHPEKY
ncbi:hypothetical protein MEZE111188_13310 [Mesobacillus zeae]